VAEKHSHENWLERARQRARALKAETYALYLAYRDPRVPWYAKVLAAVVVGYAFSPLDLVPDFIPVLGYLDDLVLVPLGIALSLKFIPPDVMAEARIAATEAMEDERPRNRYVAAVIILIWLLLLALSIVITLSLFR
jgi:uncharacterized membrane protein YkvA (DUF1232 family)